MEIEKLNEINKRLTPISIKGKEYNTVNQRILAFWELFPNGAIETEINLIESGVALCKAVVKDGEKIIATGHALEKEKSSYINETSFIENCETSAVGRALGILGIGATTSVASAEEMQNAINNQKSQIKREDFANNTDYFLALVKNDTNRLVKMLEYVNKKLNENIQDLDELDGATFELVDKTVKEVLKNDSKNRKDLAQVLLQVSMLSGEIKGGKAFDVEIKQHRERRSLDANAYFHLLVNKIAEVMKIGNDECKVKLNLEYGTPMRIDEHTLFACKVPKNADIKSIIKYPKYVKTVIENGKELNVYMAYKETHTLDSKEMARLIDGVVYEAKELGIETRTPAELEEMKSLWSEYEKYNK